MRMFLRAFPLSFAMLAFQPAQAATVACTITLTNVTVDYEGNIYISGRDTASATSFAWQYICNITTVAHSVGLESCKSWVASTLTAVSSGKSMQVFFNDADMAGRSNCANLPAWNPFKIQYLGLNN